MLNLMQANIAKQKASILLLNASQFTNPELWYGQFYSGNMSNPGAFVKVYVGAEGSGKKWRYGSYQFNNSKRYK